MIAKIKKNLAEPLVKRFFLFFFLQGLTANFSQFQYFFNKDIVNIDQFWFGLSAVLGGVTGIFAPILYQKHFNQVEYSSIYKLTQIIFVAQAILHLFQALRLNPWKPYSDIFILLLGSHFIMSIEMIFTTLPGFIIMSKLINPGIEGFMIAITMQIIMFSGHIMKELMGLLVNQLFFGITNDTNFEADYWRLPFCHLVLTLVPFLYIDSLIPKRQ